MIWHFIVHTAIFNDQACHFNLLLPQVSSSSALLYYQALKNARSRLSTHSKNWNGLVELFFGDLKLCFQNVKTITWLHDKRAPKKWKSLAKIIFLDVGTTVRHTFPSSELHCLPHGDPKNLCVNTRIRFLATHSLHALCFMWFSDGSGASFQLHPTEVLNPAVLILFHETNSGFIFYWQCRLSVLSLKEYL